ncbi:hypothetical protein [Planctomicrobium sp. SH527]|uniref:hypothetical protein n=1 Tax=Planctomicrobium sp. SH527 TaxID=3448123 RepID=UPI003F5C0CB9
MRRLAIFVVAMCSWLAPVLQHDAFAQPSEYDPSKTLLEIELVLPAGPSPPLLPHQWRGEFEKTGEAVRIRQALADDKPRVTERSRGPFRIVKLTGMVHLDGTVEFPDRKFRVGQSQELTNWIQEIKQYGALGSPSGRPLWGLTNEQFATLKQSLSAPVVKPTQGVSLQAAIESLPLSSMYPLEYHSSVHPQWESSAKTVVTEEFEGLSSGTSLAGLLSLQGYGFRPVRTPAGGIKLLVQPLVEIKDAWPVGWPVDPARPRNEQFPALFATVNTGIDDAPLSAALDAIEQKTQVRLILDRWTCAEKELDPNRLIISYPSKNTAWALIVSHIVVNAHMTMNYRQDETGKGFVWITPFAHYSPPKVVPAPKPVRSPLQGTPK